jgi:hypothetical protein
LPFAWHDDRLAFAWPRRHCHGNGGEGLMTERPKLEVGSQRDRNADTGVDIDDAPLPLLLSPHLATARNKVPDLFDGSMRDCFRYLTWRKFEMSHSAGRQSEKDSYFRPIWGKGISIHRHVLCCKIRQESSPFGGHPARFAFHRFVTITKNVAERDVCPPSASQSLG